MPVIIKTNDQDQLISFTPINSGGVIQAFEKDHGQWIFDTEKQVEEFLQLSYGFADFARNK